MWVLVLEHTFTPTLGSVGQALLDGPQLSTAP